MNGLIVFPKNVLLKYRKVVNSCSRYDLQWANTGYTSCCDNLCLEIFEIQVCRANFCDIAVSLRQSQGKGGTEHYRVQCFQEKIFENCVMCELNGTLAVSASHNVTNKPQF